MKKILTILNHSLTLLIMLFLFYSFLLPKNTNAQIQPGDDLRKLGLVPFSQPDMGPKLAINKYDYYGSGDVNNDGVIDFNDVSAMQNGETNDRADIDGDGTPSTENDQQILMNYLNGNIRYLPSHWNYLNGIEKRNWVQKMLAIDSVNYNPYIPDGDSIYTCVEFSKEMLINNFGVDSLINYIGYWKFLNHGDENARFNIPVYMVFTKIQVQSENPTGHVISGVLVGPNDTTHFQENPLNFNEWYFFEPEDDGEVHPGDPEMNKNFPVKIKWWGWDFALPPPDHPDFSYRGLVEFNLNNGEASVNWYNPYLVLSNPNDTLVSVENQGGLENKVNDFELGNAYPNPTNGFVNIPYKTNKFGKVTFEIYNELGQLVERVTGKGVTAGKHNFAYNLTKLPSGVYLIRAQTDRGNFSSVKVINMK